MANLVLSGDTSGTVTLSAPAVAGTTTLTLPTTSGTVLTTASTAVVTQAMLATNVAGNGPAFSAYGSSATTITNATWTKITFDLEIFDTNSNFASSRFTPTVAGYYQVNTSWQSGFVTSLAGVAFYKSGSPWQYGNFVSGTSVGVQAGAGALIYCNGSTDYIEIYAYQATGSSQNTTTSSSATTWFSGAMVRSA